MTVSPEELLVLSRHLVAAIDSRITVHAVTSADGDANRAELLVTVSGCHQGTCALVLNVNRSDAARAKQEIIARLRDALFTHLQDPSFASGGGDGAMTGSADVTQTLEEAAARIDDLSLTLEEVTADAAVPVRGADTIEEARAALDRASDAIEETLTADSLPPESDDPSPHER